jgi:hypothetical protein
MAASRVALAVDHTVEIVETVEIVKNVRSEVACVRALLDELERVAPSSLDERAISGQLVEDLARLGCRFLEAAGALARVVDPVPAPRSGVRLRNAPGIVRPS